MGWTLVTDVIKAHIGPEYTRLPWWFLLLSELGDVSLVSDWITFQERD